MQPLPHRLVKEREKGQEKAKEKGKAKEVARGKVKVDQKGLSENDSPIPERSHHGAKVVRKVTLPPRSLEKEKGRKANQKGKAKVLWRPRARRHSKKPMQWQSKNSLTDKATIG